MARFILIDPWLADVGGHNFQYALDVLQAAEGRGYQPALAVNQSLSAVNRLPNTWKIFRLFKFGLCSRYWLGPDGKNPRPCDLDGKLLFEPGAKAELGLVSRWADVLAQFDRRRRILDFARGCAELFETVQPTVEDQLFLPSMSEFDLLGFARFLRDCPASQPLTWHLQFHFNIFSGRDPEYAKQNLTLSKCQLQFQAALGQIPDHQLKFYATTPAMARQFDRIGIGQFQPLPYPVRDLTRGSHAEHATASATAKRPLRITFAGGMRREKGKKKFGALIRSVWSDCLASRRMQFVFQAPPRQVARWLPRDLRRRVIILPADHAVHGELATAHLCTVRHPLDAPAYNEFIQRTDVGLFLYDSRRYFARASGIVGEMLAAGIPVIVPAGCWLADQISPEMYQHVASLCLSDFSGEARDLELKQGQTSGQATYRLSDTFSDLAIQFQCPRQMSTGTFFEVTAEFDGVDSGNAGHTKRIILGPITAAAINRMNVSSEDIPIGAVVPITRGAQQVRLSVAWAYHQAPMPVEIIRVTPLKSPEGHDHHPRSCIGLIFTTDDDVPELLREADTHYGHYRQTAEGFATAWLDAHHPDRTIEVLESTELAALT